MLKATTHTNISAKGAFKATKQPATKQQGRNGSPSKLYSKTRSLKPRPPKEARESRRVQPCEITVAGLTGSDAEEESDSPTAHGGARKCSGCLKVWYCSRNCQGWHWEQGHDEECRVPGVCSICSGVGQASRRTKQLRVARSCTKCAMQGPAT